ncbi:hypothetical protein OFB58_27755, partial [Escherichia coli]|nr:hypothetical protein [Escherichia coli]
MSILIVGLMLELIIKVPTLPADDDNIAGYISGLLINVSVDHCAQFLALPCIVVTIVTAESC